MDIGRRHEVLESPGDLACFDPGKIFIEIEYPYDDALGDPAIHFFEIVDRDGEAVTIAGIAKDRVPGTDTEPDFRRRVRPVPGAFVRACRICHEREFALYERSGEPWPSFAKISDARWNAYDGTGAEHDHASPQFDHAFADFIPTATVTACFAADEEPYLRAGTSTMLFLVEPNEDLRYLGNVS